MHIERLDENKLKIVLSNLDFEDFSVSKKQLAMNRDMLRYFILKLMDTINEETDFNPYNGNIMIEAKEHNEGMSIIISKAPQRKKYTKDELKNARYINASPKNKQKSFKKEIFNIYKFDNFEDMCNALAMIDDFVHINSELYKYDDTYCYLLMINESFAKDEKIFCKSLSIFNEYSDYSQTGNIKSNHIKEHGTLVARGEDLVNMVQGIRNINIL